MKKTRVTREEYVQQIRAKCDELAKVLTSRAFSVTELAFNEDMIRYAVAERSAVAEHNRKRKLARKKEAS